MNSRSAFDPVMTRWCCWDAASCSMGASPRRGSKSIFLSIGATTALACSIFSTNLAAQDWTKLPPLPDGPRQRGAAATGPDSALYVVGGSRAGKDLKTVVVCKAINQTCVLTQDMPTARANLAVVTAPDGFIYAIGGSTGNAATDVVERFDVAKQQWTTMPKLLKPRAHLAAAVGTDGMIYVIGGSESLFGAKLNSVEVFDGSAWKPAKWWLGKPRSEHASVTGIDGDIYTFDGDPNGQAPTTETLLTGCCHGFPSTGRFPTFTTGPNGLIYEMGGGYGKLCASDEAQSFDPSTASWEALKKMSQKRGKSMSAARDGRILVLGGDGAQTCGQELSSAESLGPIQAPNFDPNRRAHYRFDGLTGLNQDSSPNGNHLVLSVKFTPTTGRVKNGIPLYGSTHFATAADSPSLNFGTGDLSIEAWIRPAGPGSLVNQFMTILDKRVALPGGKYRGYHLFLYPGGRLGLQIANGVSYANYLSVSPTTQPSHLSIAFSRWTHIAVTASRTSNPRGVLYINGAIAGEFVPLQGDVTNTAPLTVSRHSLNGDATFRGVLDELTLYDRVLTWSEIRAVFLAGREGKK